MRPGEEVLGASWPTIGPGHVFAISNVNGELTFSDNIHPAGILVGELPEGEQPQIRKFMFVGRGYREGGGLPTDEYYPERFDGHNEDSSSNEIELADGEWVLGPLSYEESLEWDPQKLTGQEKERYEDELPLDENFEPIYPEPDPDERRTSVVRDADGHGLVVYSGGDPEFFERAFHGSSLYREAGYPAARVRLARTGEPIVDQATGEVIVEAGQRVQVSDYVEGGRTPTWQEYASGPVHDQVKLLFGISYALGDADGIEFDNLVVGPDGTVHLVDMDNTLHAHTDSPARGFTSLRRNTAAFGDLTEDRITGQFRAVLDRQEQLLDLPLPDEMRARLVARLNYMENWVVEHNDAPAGDVDEPAQVPNNVAEEPAQIPSDTSVEGSEASLAEECPAAGPCVDYVYSPEGLNLAPSVGSQPENGFEVLQDVAHDADGTWQSGGLDELKAQQQPGEKAVGATWGDGETGHLVVIRVDASGATTVTDDIHPDGIPDDELPEIHKFLIAGKGHQEGSGLPADESYPKRFKGRDDTSSRGHREESNKLGAAEDSSLLVGPNGTRFRATSGATESGIHDGVADTTPGEADPASPAERSSAVDGPGRWTLFFPQRDGQLLPAQPDERIAAVITDFDASIRPYLSLKSLDTPKTGSTEQVNELPGAGQPEASSGQLEELNIRRAKIQSSAGWVGMVLFVNHALGSLGWAALDTASDAADMASRDMASESAVVDTRPVPTDPAGPLNLPDSSPAYTGPDASLGAGPDISKAADPAAKPDTDPQRFVPDTAPAYTPSAPSDASALIGAGLAVPSLIPATGVMAAAPYGLTAASGPVSPVPPVGFPMAWERRLEDEQDVYARFKDVAFGLAGPVRPSIYRAARAYQEIAAKLANADQERYDAEVKLADLKRQLADQMSDPALAEATYQRLGQLSLELGEQLEQLRAKAAELDRQASQQPKPSTQQPQRTVSARARHKNLPIEPRKDRPARQHNRDKRAAKQAQQQVKGAEPLAKLVDGAASTAREAQERRQEVRDLSEDLHEFLNPNPLQQRATPATTRTRILLGGLGLPWRVTTQLMLGVLTGQLELSDIRRLAAIGDPNAQIEPDALTRFAEEFNLGWSDSVRAAVLAGLRLFHTLPTQLRDYYLVGESQRQGAYSHTALRALAELAGLLRAGLPQQVYHQLVHLVLSGQLRPADIGWLFAVGTSLPGVDSSFTPGRMPEVVDLNLDDSTVTVMVVPGVTEWEALAAVHAQLDAARARIAAARARLAAMLGEFSDENELGWSESIRASVAAALGRHRALPADQRTHTSEEDARLTQLVLDTWLRADLPEQAYRDWSARIAAGKLNLDELSERLLQLWRTGRVEVRLAGQDRNSYDTGDMTDSDRVALIAELLRQARINPEQAGSEFSSVSRGDWDKLVAQLRKLRAANAQKTKANRQQAKVKIDVQFLSPGNREKLVAELLGKVQTAYQDRQANTPAKTGQASVRQFTEADQLGWDRAIVKAIYLALRDFGRSRSARATAMRPVELNERQREVTAWMAATLAQNQELAVQLGMTPDELAANLAVARRLLQAILPARQGQKRHQKREREPEGSLGELRLAGFDRLALLVLLGHAEGLTPQQISEKINKELGLNKKSRKSQRVTFETVEGILEAIPHQLANNSGPNTGRAVLTESNARAVLVTTLGTSEEWQRMRKRLRGLEQRLHPAERALLWNRADRIEELIERLPTSHRDEVYRLLIQAGFTSNAGLRAMHTDQLLAAGLSRKQIGALRSALGKLGVIQTRGAAGLRLTQLPAEQWRHRELATALALAVGWPAPGPDTEITTAYLDRLREANGFEQRDTLVADLGLPDPGGADVDPRMLALFAGLGHTPLDSTNLWIRLEALRALDAQVTARVGAKPSGGSGAGSALEGNRKLGAYAGAKQRTRGKRGKASRPRGRQGPRSPPGRANRTVDTPASANAKARKGQPAKVKAGAKSTDDADQRTRWAARIAAMIGLTALFLIGPSFAASAATVAPTATHTSSTSYLWALGPHTWLANAAAIHTVGRVIVGGLLITLGAVLAGYLVKSWPNALRNRVDRDTSRFLRAIENSVPAEWVNAADPEIKVLTGHTRAEFAAANIKGLIAIDQLDLRARLLFGARRERPVQLGPDRWVYLDTRLLGVLRAGLPGDGRAELFSAVLDGRVPELAAFPAGWLETVTGGAPSELVAAERGPFTEPEWVELALAVGAIADLRIAIRGGWPMHTEYLEALLHSARTLVDLHDAVVFTADLGDPVWANEAKRLRALLQVIDEHLPDKAELASLPLVGRELVSYLTDVARRVNRVGRLNPSHPNAAALRLIPRLVVLLVNRGPANLTELAAALDANPELVGMAAWMSGRAVVIGDQPATARVALLPPGVYAGRETSHPADPRIVLVRLHDLVQFPVPGKITAIGRHPGADISLESRRVSRAHAVLLRYPEGWELANLGAKSPTLINGMPVVGTSAPVGPGDRITLGGDEYVLAVSGEIARPFVTRRSGLAPAAVGLFTGAFGYLLSSSALSGTLGAVALGVSLLAAALYLAPVFFTSKTAPAWAERGPPRLRRVLSWLLRHTLWAGRVGGRWALTLIGVAGLGLAVGIGLHALVGVIAAAAMVPLDPRWQHKLSQAKLYRNLRPDELDDEVIRMAGASQLPATIPDLAVMQYLAGLADVWDETRSFTDEKTVKILWVLREDGILRVSPASIEVESGGTRSAHHPWVGYALEALRLDPDASPSLPAYAAGEAYFRPAGTGVLMNIESGHYHPLNTDAENVEVALLGREAFERDGFTFEHIVWTPGSRRQKAHALLGIHQGRVATSVEVRIDELLARTSVDLTLRLGDISSPRATSAFTRIEPGTVMWADPILIAPQRISVARQNGEGMLVRAWRAISHTWVARSTRFWRALSKHLGNNQLGAWITTLLIVATLMLFDHHTALAMASEVLFAGGSQPLRRNVGASSPQDVLAKLIAAQLDTRSGKRPWAETRVLAEVLRASLAEVLDAVDATTGLMRSGDGGLVAWIRVFDRHPGDRRPVATHGEVLVSDLEAGRPLMWSGDGVKFLGRHHSADEQFTGPGVSRVHALLVRLGGEWYLADLGSSFGSWFVEHNSEPGVQYREYP
ncbi:MAG TPA: FHA domain-containing protein, partial [Mycobacterium sp.]|nr:FHA domain-containing protein [Mycobacterium sp.]